MAAGTLAYPHTLRCLRNDTFSDFRPGVAHWFEKTVLLGEQLVRTYIVEDNPTIRENLIGTLEELAGVETVGFSETEKHGTEWLQNHGAQWDLAIVDLFLKQGSGMGVIEACRKRDPNQKVVVLTNYATPDIRSRCHDLGVDAVFDKSNDIDALIDFCISLNGTGVN